MKMLHSLAVASSLLACALASAGQRPGAQEIKPFRQLSIGKAKTIDTIPFGSKTAIDLKQGRVMAENPALEDWKDHTPSSNTLPVGEVIDATRVTPGRFWPAISFTGWSPADPTLAVGPNHVIVTVNSQIAFYDKNGGQTFNQAAQTFFSGLGATDFQYDPRVLFDRLTQRYYLLFAEQRDSGQISKILLAVSDDANPNGTWYRYRIEAKYTSGGSSYWMDYPSFGFNKDGIVICGNMFGFSSGFAGTEFITIPKAPLLSGGTATASYVIDSNAGSVQLADTWDPNLGYAFGVEDWNTSSLKLHALGNLGGTPTYTTTTITVPSFGYPTQSAPSSPGRLDTLDGRLYQATWRTGKLLAMHTTQSGGVNRVRWYEIGLNNWPNGSPSLIQAGNVAPPSGPHFHMGGVAENGVGDISMGFTRSASSGDGKPADFMAAGHKFSDALGVMGTPTLLQASFGSGYQGSGTNRWGDYFRTVVDPVDDLTFWGVGMVADSGGNWQAVVNRWTVSQETTVAPTSLNLFRGIAISGGLGELATSDDQRYIVRNGLVANGGESPITLDLSATAPSATLGSLKFVLEGQASTTGLNQSIDLWDWTTSAWVTIDTRAATMNADSAVVASASGNLSRFVQGGTLAVKARLRLRPAGLLNASTWQYRFDQAVWRFVS